MSEPAPANPPALPEATSRARLVAALAVAFVCGGFQAVQSRINGALGAALDDGYFAALISFAVGILVLLAAYAVWPPGRRGMTRLWAAFRDREIPWWYAAGGVFGAFFVLTQTLTVGLLGVALFTVGTVSGQVVGSLLIDRKGVGTMAPKPLTATRIVAALIAFVAVVVAMSAELRSDVSYWVLIVPLLAGLGIGAQQAVNGQLRAASGSTLTATLVSFVAGAAVLVVAVGIHTGIVGWPQSFPPNALLYLGGLFGAMLVAGQAAVVRITGVLLLGLAILAGQLIASVVVDLVAPLEGTALQPTTLIGAVLTLAAVTVAAIPSRRTRELRRADRAGADR